MRHIVSRTSGVFSEKLHTQNVFCLGLHKFWMHNNNSLMFLPDIMSSNVSNAVLHTQKTT